MRTLLLTFLICFLAAGSHAQAKRLDSLINAAISTNDTGGIVRYFIEKTDTYGVDTAGFGKISTNNLIYNYIFHYSHDRRELKKAVGYMQELLRIPMADDEMGNGIYAAWLDTYANLLYKLGKRNQALKSQERAVRRSPGNEENTAHLQKMKARIPTWK